MARIKSSEQAEAPLTGEKDPSSCAVEHAAEWVHLSKLIPWVKNPRKNDPAVPGIVRSIIRWGFGNPLLARAANGEVIAGHTRLKAVKRLKREWIAATPSAREKWHHEAKAIAESLDPLLPVRYRDLSEKEAHLLALADNKTGEVAEWDDSAVDEVLRDCTLTDIADAGWTGDDLEKLTDSILGLGETAPKEARVNDGFSVVIECDSEEQQLEVISWAQEQGLKCKALI